MIRTIAGLLCVIGVVAIAGCRGGHPFRARQPSTFESIGQAVTPDASFADRHPVVSEPRRYYQEAGPNPVVKGFAGVVGVPVGIVKETTQLIRGR